MYVSFRAARKFARSRFKSAVAILDQLVECVGWNSANLVGDLLSVFIDAAIGQPYGLNLWNEKWSALHVRESEETVTLILATQRVREALSLFFKGPRGHVPFEERNLVVDRHVRHGA